MAALQAEEIFACLVRHRVQFIVIGGLAAVLHGSPVATFDADVCPARDPENLGRLATALKEMDARIRTPDTPGGLRFGCDAVFLAGVSILNLVTKFGELDLSFTPSGTGGYSDLERRVHRMSIRDFEIPVAALDDVIRSKEAANREKDRLALPLLRRLREEIANRGPKA